MFQPQESNYLCALCASACDKKKGKQEMKRKEFIKAMGAAAGAAAYPKAKIDLKGLALYGHVAQKEPEAVKNAVAKWLKQFGK